MMGFFDSLGSFFDAVIEGVDNIITYMMSNLDAVAFLCIMVVALASAAFVVMSKEIVHSAFYLSLTMVCVAITYFFLEAEFVGVVQLMVYVGAVTIVFAFSIMLTRRTIMGGDDDE